MSASILPVDETKMLAVAAANHTLLRTALNDCVNLLEWFKERDQNLRRVSPDDK